MSDIEENNFEGRVSTKPREPSPAAAQFLGVSPEAARSGGVCGVTCGEPPLRPRRLLPHLPRWFLGSSPSPDATGESSHPRPLVVVVFLWRLVGTRTLAPAPLAARAPCPGPRPEAARSLAVRVRGATGREFPLRPPSGRSAPPGASGPDVRVAGTRAAPSRP